MLLAGVALGCVAERRETVCVVRRAYSDVGTAITITRGLGYPNNVRVA